MRVSPEQRRRPPEPASWLRAALRSPLSAGLLATAALLAALLTARANGVLQPLELDTYDALLAARAINRPPDQRLLQVSITEAEINRFGWPIPDGVLASAIDHLHAAHAGAIGVDIFRPSPIEPGADMLAHTLATTPELIWVNRFGQGPLPGIQAPAAMEGADRTGFADMVLDPGGIARRGLLYLDNGGEPAESLPLRLAMIVLESKGVVPEDDGNGLLRLGPTSLPVFAKNTGGYARVDTRGYQILREFRSGTTLTTVTLGELLDAKATVDIAGRVALIGVVADSVKDNVISPFGGRSSSELPGVTLQGLFTSQLLGHALDHILPTRPLPEPYETALIALCVLSAGILAVMQPNGANVATLALGGGSIIVGAAVLAFIRAVWLPVLPMAGGWVAAAALSGSVAAFAEKRQHALLMRLFSAAVSAPVARELWRRRHEFSAGGRPVPVRLTVTMLFADINDFTSVSETLEPDTLVRWLDLCMKEMARVVGEHRGIVSSFVGDGLMAVFGAPIARHSASEIAADASSATRCALGIGAVLQSLNEAYARDGLPAMRAAVGVYSGVVVACSLGIAERQQYTVIGDPANTASRLVQIAKDRMRNSGNACLTVIGEPTRDLVHHEFALDALGPQEVKGKSQRLQCYLVTSMKEVPGSNMDSAGRP